MINEKLLKNQISFVFDRENVKLLPLLGMPCCSLDKLARAQGKL